MRILTCIFWHVWLSGWNI